jgi:hypothetical protein
LRELGRVESRKNFQVCSFLHRRQYRGADRLFYAVRLQPISTTFGRGNDSVFHWSHLPFSAQQILGVPVPTQRLFPAASAIFRRRGKQLVYHTRRGARLSLDIYLERLDRQALRNPLRNLERFSSHANVCV